MIFPPGVVLIGLPKKVNLTAEEEMPDMSAQG
jgi:hypothetical protein